MFSGIQNTVENKIKTFGLETTLGRNYLPIGSAITVETNNKICPYLVAAPTMFFPGNIENTDNIYYAFIAIMHVASKNPNCKIACPGLGTGIGMLKPKYAVDQMEKAILEYGNIFNTDYVQKIKYVDN